MTDKVQFTVRTIDGERREFNEPSGTLLSAVRDTAFQRFHIQPAPGQDWIFQLNGRNLDNSQTLQQAGVADGADLLFGTTDVLGDGC